MKISLPDNRDVGEAVGDSNEGMKEARDRDDAREKAIMDKSMKDSRDTQNLISSGADIVGRPQDEGYRPNAGTAKERATAEGAYDSDKITESGDQGFGGAGSSRTVKATPKAMPKVKPEPSQLGRPKVTVQDTGSDVARMMNRAKSVATPVAETPSKTKSTKVPSAEEAAANRSAAMDRIKGIGSSVSDYFKNFKTPAERKAQEGKEKGYSSGGKVSASSRGDGIAQRGKTRGKYI
jgi:hypothetical protein